MNNGKEPFRSGLRPSSLPSSLRYAAASCFHAARSADLECADTSALWSDATCRVEESDVLPSHSTPIAPIVHLKMNTGKECSRAECARLRSRLHCVTTRRVASTRQGVRRAPPFDFRHRPASCAAFQSARGLAHSKTLRVCRGRSEFPPGFGLRQPSAAFPLNRPSQTKFRKRAVQERNAPVFAPVITALRRGEWLRRGKECGVRPNLISVIAKHRA